MEERCVRKDSSHAWIELTVLLIGGSRGEPGYSISVVEDTLPSAS